ncbi:hypothetical protein TWF281_010955 [Arthrobotrys megalospora]
MPYASIPPFSFLLSVILTLFQIIPPSSAYYTVLIRETGPEWFKSFSYFMTTTNLHSRDPSPEACYEMSLGQRQDAIAALGLYNKPGEIPATALALFSYKSPSSECETLPSGAVVTPEPPTFMIVLDPNDLYGLHVVDVKKLGIQWFRGTMQALNATAEREDPNGLLYGLPQRPGSGLYVWEGDPETDYKKPKRRVYLPNTVVKVAEPRDYLETFDLTGEGARSGYIYMRDLMERYLRPEMRHLKDTISPWFDDDKDGKFDHLEKKPVMTGPLFSKDKTTALNKGKNSNRHAWQKLSKAIPHLKQKMTGKGWTKVWRGPEEGSVPGMEYYDLNRPIALNPNPLEDGMNGNNELSEQNSLSGGSADGVYVHIPDEIEITSEVKDETAFDSTDIPRTLHRMRRLHETAPSATLMEEEHPEEQPIQKPNTGVKIEPQLNDESQYQSTAPDSVPVIEAQEIKQEEEESSSANVISPSLSSNPNMVGGNQPPDMLAEGVQALRGGPFTNIEDPAALPRAQQESLANRNEMVVDFSPFRYRYTSTSRDRNRPGMAALEDPVFDRQAFRSSTSSGSRNRNGAYNFPQNEGQGRSLEDYEEYPDPQGRNLRNREPI